MPQQVVFRECELRYIDRFFVQAKHGAAAAAHRGVEGPCFVKPAFDIFQFRKAVKNIFLEVVGKPVLPLLHASCDHLAEPVLWLSGNDAFVRFGRAAVNGGVNHHDKVFVQTDRGRTELVAFSAGEHRFILNEKSAIAPQPCGAGDAIGYRYVKLEFIVYQVYEESGVCRASAEAGASGYGFVQVGFNGREFVFFVEQPVGFAHEVVAAASQLEAGYGKAELIGALAVCRVFDSLKRVLPAYGVEHGLNIVKAVGTFFYNIQAKVYLCVRETNHMSKIGIDIEKAKQILQNGGLVAIPTETVYGLAASALDTKAVLKIFEAKQRPHFDPLIIHTDCMEKARNWVAAFPQWAQQLAEKFWPGPLTLLLPKKNIPDIVTSGLETVAVRVPDHKLTLELLRSIDFPLAAPSANPFGYVSPTTPQHVAQQLEEKVDYILDGGACEVGIESTIVGMEDGRLCVFRLGGLAVEEIEKVVGKVDLRLNLSSDPKAPGMLKHHYAPAKALFIGDIKGLMARFAGKRIGVISFTADYAGAEVKVLSRRADLGEAAQNLFAAMRELDASAVDVILAEEFPDSFLGRAINDRLRRAAVK